MDLHSTVLIGEKGIQKNARLDARPQHADAMYQLAVRYIHPSDFTFGMEIKALIIYCGFIFAVFLLVQW